MKPLSVEDGTQCKTILTFSNTRCRLLEGHSGDHVGKLTDMAAPMNTKGVEETDRKVARDKFMLEATDRACKDFAAQWTKGVEDGISDEQAVRQVYPDAYIVGDYSTKAAVLDRFDIVIRSTQKVIGSGRARKEAWAAARSKLLLANLPDETVTSAPPEPKFSRTVEWAVQFEHKSGSKISVRKTGQAEAREIYDRARLGNNEVAVRLMRYEEVVIAERFNERGSK